MQHTKEPGENGGGGLAPIGNELREILMSLGCPLPPEMIQDTQHEPERYVGTQEDYRTWLENMRQAAERSLTRDRADAKAAADAVAVDMTGTDIGKATTEYLRKMRRAVDLGLAEWHGSGWRIKPKPQPQRPGTRHEYPLFTEEHISSHFHKARNVGSGKWTACCPAHNDRHPSLSITRGRSRWLLHCFSQGCSWIDIVHAAHIDGLDLKIGGRG